MLVPRSAENPNDIEAREPCMRGVSRPSRLSPRAGGNGQNGEGKKKKKVKKPRRRPGVRPGVDYGHSRLNDGAHSVWADTPDIKTETS